MVNFVRNQPCVTVNLMHAFLDLPRDMVVGKDFFVEGSGCCKVLRSVYFGHFIAQQPPPLISIRALWCLKEGRWYLVYRDLEHTVMLVLSSY